MAAQRVALSVAPSNHAAALGWLTPAQPCARRCFDDLAKEREQQLRQAIAGSVVATSGSTKHTPTQGGVDDILATLQAMGALHWNGKPVDGKLTHFCVDRPHVIWLFRIGLRDPKALDGVKKLAQQMLRMFMVQLQVR